MPDPIAPRITARQGISPDQAEQLREAAHRWVLASDEVTDVIVSPAPMHDYAGKRAAIDTAMQREHAAQLAFYALVDDLTDRTVPSLHAVK